MPELTPEILWVGGGAAALFAALVLVIAFRRLRKSSPPRALAPPPRERPTLLEPPEGAVPALGKSPATKTATPAPTDAAAPPAPQPAETRKTDWRAGLRRTRGAITGRLESLLRGRASLDEAALQEVEAILYGADLGVRTAEELLEAVRTVRSPDEVQPLLAAKARAILAALPSARVEPSEKPHVILVVGVNGSGKTTSIGKLAARYARSGKRVVVAAGDTYRAAAIEQLAVWAERSGAEIVKGAPGGDPASVAFDALKAARTRDFDVVIVDTAGRLQTDQGLMDELAKIQRVMRKEIPSAPHEVLLVLDGNTGQNAIRQAQEFKKAVDVSGIVLSKLDGTARGGVVLGIAQEVGLPVRYVGLGEAVEDLADFEAAEFVAALFAADP